MSAPIDPLHLERACKVLARAGFSVEKTEESKTGTITLKIKASGK